MSTKRNNLKIANITPKDFSPPPFRYFPHIRIPSIKEAEMKHFKNFIKSTGGNWTLSKNKKRSSMMVASGADSSMMNYVTEKGFFLDGQGGSLCNRAVIFMMLGSTTLTYMDYLYL